jgi:CBS domain-containing protein
LRQDEISAAKIRQVLAVEDVMKVREVMTPDPVCCVPGDTAQSVANIMCEHNVGSIPVVVDQQSRKLTGIITDRDLCCSIIAQGFDPKSTPIQRFMRQNPVACRDGENLDSCEQAMQKHQIRRIPVTDGDGRCIGIVAQADLALKDKPEKVSKTVTEISKPQSIAA